MSDGVLPRKSSVLARLGSMMVRGRRQVRSVPADPRPSVLHLAKHCGHANGNVHVAVDLACGQADAGYDVIFASGGGTFVKLLEQHGVEHVMLEQSQTRPLGLLLSALRLARLCRQRRPSVLHAHMMAGAVIGFAASKVTGIPLVTTVHNSFDRHSFLMRLGTHIVAVSEAEKRELVRRGCSPARVTTIWNAPDRSPRESFMVNTRDYVLRRPNVVAICALHRRKGVFDLIDACATALPLNPAWHLYIAGEGPDRERLEQQAAAAGLAERVTFLGFVPSPRTLFGQADIFVLTSYADPGSLSIGEARAAGCAIIATAVGGTTEMLEFGAAGCLIPSGSPERLAVELGRLMQDPAQRAALRTAASRGAEVFDVDRLVPDYAKAYDIARAGRGNATAGRRPPAA